MELTDKILLLSLLAAASTWSTGCTRSSQVSGSSIRISADYFSISGRAIDEAGMPVEGASVFMDTKLDAVTTTDATGSFVYAMSDSAIQQMKNQIDAGQLTPQIFVELNAGEKTVLGVSETIVIRAGDRLALEDIRLTAPLNYSAQVFTYGSGGELTPAEAVRATAYHDGAATDSNGNLDLRNLPRTNFKLNLQKAGFETLAWPIEGAGQSKIIDRIPLVMFKENEVAAVLHDVARYEEEPKFDQNHPYRRRFAVSNSLSANVIAYSSKREDLDKVNPEDWRPLTRDFSFDFEGIGEKTLYYRVADRAFANPSPVASIRVFVDLFKQNQGIKLGDGTGVIRSKTFDVEIDVPTYASQMRISQDPGAFLANVGAGSTLDSGDFRDTSTGWMSVSAKYRWTYQFPEESRLPDQISMYVQFRTPRGEESPVFYGTALLAPFQGLDYSFKIEGGAPQSSERIVELTIKPPSNATEMVVFEEVIANNTGVISGSIVTSPIRDNLDRYWLPVQPKLFFTFQSAGRKELFIKFRTADGLESPLTKQLIHILPFLPQSMGVEINDGAGVTGSRNLLLELNPPPRAVGFRISENERELNDVPYQSFLRTLPYRASRSGLVTIFVQYLDLDGNNSFVSSKSIMIDPYAGGAGQFVINGGNPLAISSILHLGIAPPEGAVEMQIGRAALGSNQDPFSESTWMPVELAADYTLPSLGTYTVYLRFRNIDGEVSASVARTINYDPFPPGSIGVSTATPLSYQRQVLVALTAPTAAWKMLVSTNPDDFTGGFSGNNGNGGSFSGGSASAFVGYQPNYIVQLPAASGDYRIYAQFQAFDLTFSQVISIPINLQLFPAHLMNFNINDFAANSLYRLVNLNLQAPPSAVGVQVAEDLQTLGISPVRQIAPQIQFTLSPGIGIKTVYVRYVADLSRLDQSSGVIQRTIYFDPFDGVTQPFTIDSNAATTNDTTVAVQLNVPSRLVSYRIGETASLLADSPFTLINGNFDFVLSAGDGLKTVYMQFATAEGSESSVFARQITLDTTP